MRFAFPPYGLPAEGASFSEFQTMLDAFHPLLYPVYTGALSCKCGIVICEVSLDAGHSSF